jgi:GDP-mannose 6-dehydrogenase
MRISIFGLGYVGAVSAGCLADRGHTVVGVDPFQAKVDLINAGQTPIIEKDIGELIKKAVDDERLRATTDVADAIFDTEISMVCVGTPSQFNGSLDLSAVRKVCEQIGAAIKEKENFHVVVMRSTMLPGTMRSLVIPVLEEFSGKRAGVDFGICNNPEFLRESTAVYDFNNPPKTVIGTLDNKSGDMLVSIYDGIEAPMIVTEVETAEMVKYADNVWHALKVSFANEIGVISKSVGIDGQKVMDIFCKDKKLNLSSYYMRPGFSFGGSCLPKDVRALTYKGRDMDLELPVLNAIMPSNNAQLQRGLDMVMKLDKKKIGILGFSFKAGTDDLRESPIVELIERLIGKGYDIKIYDRNVNIAKLVGANRDYIMNRIPHIARLMVEDMSVVKQHAEVIVVGNSSEEFKGVEDDLKVDQIVIDLVRISDKQSSGQYHGICW